MNELSNFSKEEANFISEDSYYDDRDEISKIVFSSFLNQNFLHSNLFYNI
jgi:uridine kinase